MRENFTGHSSPAIMFRMVQSVWAVTLVLSMSQPLVVHSSGRFSAAEAFVTLGRESTPCVS